MPLALTAPDTGTELDGAIQVFAWSFDGEVPDSSWLYAGSTPGGSQYGRRSTVHIRLWYRVDSRWRFTDETFVAAAEPRLPFLTSPSPGGRLTGPGHRFTWDYSSAEPEQAWLYVGADIGDSDYGALFVETATEATIRGLPTDGSPVHTRLYFRLAGAWHFVDDVFSAATVVPPTKDELTRELQSLVGASADGIVGPRTRAALNRNWLGSRSRFDNSFSARLINDAAVVSWVQTRITAQGGPDLTADGEFDDATDAAVRSHLGRGGVVAAESFLRLLDAQLEPGGG